MDKNYGLDCYGKNIKLGQKVECIVTGFKGTVVGLYEYIHGCMRVNVQPSVDNDGKIPTDAVMDAPQIKIVGFNQIMVAPAADKRLSIGDEGEDTISGFKGVITGRASFINGCHRVGLSPRVDKDGKTRSTEWFDEPQVETKVAPAPKERQVRTGGPVSSRDLSRF